MAAVWWSSNSASSIVLVHIMAIMQEGDNAFRDLEYQALAQVKGAAGLEPSLEAMHQVFGHEGDVILTRCAAPRHF